MYASNVDDEWIYLHEASTNKRTNYEQIVNTSDEEDSSLSSSTSSSRSSSLASSSPKRMRRTSISPNEFQRLQNDDIHRLSISNSSDDDKFRQNLHVLETGINENSFIFHYDNRQIINSNDQMLATETVNDSDDLSSELIILHENDNSIMELSMNSDDPANETNATSNVESMQDETVLSRICSRCKTVLLNSRCSVEYLTSNCSDATRTASNSQEMKQQKYHAYNHNSNYIHMHSIQMILFLILPLIIGYIAARWDRPILHKLVEELDKTNQHLRYVKIPSIKTAEQQITILVDDKLQNIVNQQSVWHGQEENALGTQILELRQALQIMQQNWTDKIHQLASENEQLREKIKAFEHNFETAQSQSVKTVKLCVHGINCTKSKSSLHTEIGSDLFRAKVLNATHIAKNLSNISKYIQVTINKITDRQREYAMKIKNKLMEVASSLVVTTRVHRSFCCGLDHIFASIHKIRSIDVTWIKSRVLKRKKLDSRHYEHGIRHRQQVQKKHIAHWTPRNSWYHEYVRHQTPLIEHESASKTLFPIHKLCTLKGWIVKFLRC